VYQQIGLVAPYGSALQCGFNWLKPKSNWRALRARFTP
jgi:hypothetical protein